MNKKCCVCNCTDTEDLIEHALAWSYGNFKQTFCVMCFASIRGTRGGVYNRIDAQLKQRSTSITAQPFIRRCMVQVHRFDEHETGELFCTSYGVSTTKESSKLCENGVAFDVHSNAATIIDDLSNAIATAATGTREQTIDRLVSLSASVVSALEQVLNGGDVIDVERWNG